ncbi:cysteine--tRNA ligase [Streptomyces griseoincarnatus]
MPFDSLSHDLRSALVLHNTATRRVEPFTPADGHTARVYVCGPTVYSAPHIGNMRTYVSSDVLRRTLGLAGYDVLSAMNITDVGHLVSDADSGDDKMARAARAESLTAWQIAAKYTELFFRETERLGITAFTHVPRATDHIGEQIALVQQLEERGVTYRTTDGIYFDTSQIPNYGKLTPHDTRDQLRAGERVAMGDKRHPTDFALWKFSHPDGPQRDMEWASPWGVGFPGWHIECSAMAMKYLGPTLDIHVGGIDHIAVHHTNEIAQSETVTGRPFARWWLHGAFLVLDGEKRMGKSEGNRITLDTLESWGYQPLEFRYLVLLSHYRSPLSFTRGALESAATAYRRLAHRVSTLREQAAGCAEMTAPSLHPHADGFIAALADDLNTPRAVAAVWNLLRDPSIGAASKLSLLEWFDQVLGLGLSAIGAAADVPAPVAELAQRRWELRGAGQYAEADKLRAELTAIGYVVEDERDGYRVRPLEGR